VIRNLVVVKVRLFSSGLFYCQFRIYGLFIIGFLIRIIRNPSVCLPAQWDRQKESILNYKQSEQFTERKNMVLLMLAHKPIDLDETGTLVPIRQIEKELKIKGKTLYRCLHSLENDGLLICTFKGYETGKKSMRWLITDKADNILKNEEFICKYYDTVHDYYKSLNKKRDTDNTVIIEGDNIGYNLYIKYNKIINIVYDLLVLNNIDSKIKSISTLRIENQNGKEKAKIKGRVHNALCLTKSGKKQNYMISDKRFSRVDYLKYKGLPDYEEIFDIKNQVPRLTYILQGGDYDDIADFYIIDGIDRWIAKKLYMSAYFEKSKAVGSWHDCRNFFNDYYKEGIKDDITREKVKSQFDKWFGVIWDDCRNLIDPIGSEIFLWTALWEQLIIKEARVRLGAHIVNVYDGFYYNDYSIKDELNNIAKETAIEVRKLYTEIADNQAA
jgi:DNA-binding PadR family transcriptional regulator